MLRYNLDILFLLFDCKIIFRIHYLHFSLVLSGVVAIIVFSISLLTPPIPAKHVSRDFCQKLSLKIVFKLRRLTFWTRFHPKARYSLTVVSRNRHKCEEKLNPPNEDG